MILYNAYRDALHLPRYLGHARITAFLRRLLLPSYSRVDHGLLMQLDPQEWTQIDILTNGGLEPRTASLFRKILRPGDTYIDVGAHVGYHTLLACQAVGPTGRVLAVEPQPYNCNKILINAALNRLSNITTIVGAVGDQDGFVLLCDQAPSDKARLTLAGNGVNDGSAKFEVPVWTLETIMRRHEIDAVRLLKIDVEGYELNVLKGHCRSSPKLRTSFLGSWQSVTRGVGGHSRASVA